MQVFITGATGFIGSQVARIAVSEGHTVFATIRPGSHTERIDDILDSLHSVPCDLLAVEELNAHLERIRPDLFIHLAWYAVPGKYPAALENLDVLSASLQLVKQLARLGTRFVQVGSCFEYDLSQGYLSETSPTKPRSLYAASKLAFDLALEQLAAVTGMSIASPRLFYQYGPFEDERRLVPAVIRALLKNQHARTTKGEQVRDFLHVEDVAEALWAVARSSLCGPVNIGSGTPVTVREIVNAIAVILDRQELVELGAISYSASDPMFVCANNRRLVENTAWSPQYDLESGLKDTIAWWQTRI